MSNDVESPALLYYNTVIYLSLEKIFDRILLGKFRALISSRETLHNISLEDQLKNLKNVGDKEEI